MALKNGRCLSGRGRGAVAALLFPSPSVSHKTRELINLKEPKEDDRGAKIQFPFVRKDETLFASSCVFLNARSSKP